MQKIPDAKDSRERTRAYREGFDDERCPTMQKRTVALARLNRGKAVVEDD
jgi:hypothetical protein